MDASFQAHDDCKGHTVAMMSLGRGSATSFSRKQKIQGKSSTKNEIIGVYESLPQALWCKLFLESQGYTI